MKHLYTLLCFSVCFSLHGAAKPLAGIWENNERIIEYSGNGDGTAEDTLRIVLKTYYRFVYEDMGSCPVTAHQESTGNVYALHIRYKGCRYSVPADVWVYKDCLFTSFYKKIPYKSVGTPERSLYQAGSTEATAPVQGSASSSDALLDGFWVEQGFRDGILIYQQELPVFFDAFFFAGTEYIRFRYWTCDVAYKDKHAEFVCSDGRTVHVPKFIRRGDAVYSCITDNGTILKNYEKGKLFIEKKGGKECFTLTPMGGGPGTHAVGDIYPHQHYPRIQSLPLYYDTADAVFAFGQPFLKRSSIVDLQKEIEHKSTLKRPSPEPLLKADELDFYWDRIKEIRGDN